MLKTSTITLCLDLFQSHLLSHITDKNKWITKKPHYAGSNLSNQPHYRMELRSCILKIRIKGFIRAPCNANPSISALWGGNKKSHRSSGIRGGVGEENVRTGQINSSPAMPTSIVKNSTQRWWRKQLTIKQAWLEMFFLLSHTQFTLYMRKTQSTHYA